MVSEVEFVSILCMLQNGSKKLPSAFHNLLSHGELPPLLVPDGELLLDKIIKKVSSENRKNNSTSISDWKWVIPFDNIYHCLDCYHGDYLIENNQLWIVSSSVLQKLCDEKGMKKKDEVLEL